MATTISTNQTYDSAARTAGDTYTINSGAIFKIDSDTRDGKNAPAARAGSWGSFTMTAATGGEVLLDGTTVWVIDYDGLQGAPNVPALGTIIAGITSGAYGELMNISASISTVPTAAGSAMPATGIIKLKSKTGTFQDNEILEIQGSTDLCTANGVGKRGWIEVVMDDAAGFTIGRAQKFHINGDWYQSGTVGSGSAHQQIQFPNYGGAGFFLPGCWVDEAANGNWEFWPACITGTGTFWAAANMSTDARSKFCECLAGGIIRFGGNGVTAWGKIPTAGALFRIPNVLLKSAATGSRASDSIPNATTTSRPDFAMTNAGSIDIDGAIGHWNIVSSQAYAIKLWNLALFDKYDISETATGLDLKECHNGNHLIAQDSAAMILTSNFAVGTVINCKWGRCGTIGAADYGTSVTYCNNLTFTGVHFQHRVVRANATGYTAYFGYCNNIIFTDCVTVGNSIYCLACNGIIFNDPLYADNYVGVSSATGAPLGILVLSSCNEVMLDGFNWYTTVTDVHPDTCVLYITNCLNVKARNIGTYASPILAYTANNAMLYFCNDAGNSLNIEFKRVYFTLIATTFYNAVNSSKNVEITNCMGNISVYKNTVSGALNQIVKNCNFADIVPASLLSIYGSIFYHNFTSSSAGRLGLKFNEDSSEYSVYVTKSFSTTATGTSGFNSGGGLALINSGDYAIFEFPYWIKGIDSFQNSAPTITTSTNMVIEYQIDTGAGWNGSWKTFNATNLSGETVDEVAGFRFKIKCSCNLTAAANILTVLYCLTNSNAAAQAIQYLLDVSELTITANVSLVGAEIRIYDLDDTPAGSLGTELSGVESCTTSTYSFEAEVSNDVWIQIMLSGYEEFGQQTTMPLVDGGYTALLAAELNA